jgi:hypothetical protein
VKTTTAGSTWFTFGVRLFAVALPLGILVAMFAPVDFARLLGAVALVGSMLGLAISLAGRRLESRAVPRAGSFASTSR